MSAIIFSKILSLGEEYDVFSLGYLPHNTEKYADKRAEVKILFILPSLAADIKIEISNFHAERLFSYIPASVSAAKFLLKVRGLPLSEITVETPLGIITVLSGNDGKCSVLMDRFYITENKEISLIGESISTRMLKSPFGKIRALKVSSAPDFSLSLLREAALSHEGEEIIGALAFDENGYAVYHFSKSGEFPKALTSAISVISCLYPKASCVKISEDVFDFSYIFGKLKVTDSGERPLIFYAPAID